MVSVSVGACRVGWLKSRGAWNAEYAKAPGPANTLQECAETMPGFSRRPNEADVLQRVSAHGSQPRCGKRERRDAPAHRVALLRVPSLRGMDGEGREARGGGQQVRVIVCDQM